MATANATDTEKLSINPDDLPDTPEGVALLLGTTLEEGENTDDDESPDPDAPVGDKDKGKLADKGSEKRTDPPADTPKDKEEPAPILTPKGDRTIPYAVLQGARERAEANAQLAAEEKAKREAAETASAALKTELEALRAGEAADKTKAGQLTDKEWDTYITELEKDAPELARVERANRQAIQARDGQIKALTDQVAELTALAPHLQQLATREHNSVQSVVDQAIDNSPKLAYLREKNPELFARAVEIDDRFKQSPKFKGQPITPETLGKRFDAVLQALELENGEIQLPTEFLSDAEVKARAKAKVAAAGDPKLGTLSDIPGGAAADRDVDTSNMQAHQIHGMMENMTDDQMQKFLSRVG